MDKLENVAQVISRLRAAGLRFGNERIYDACANGAMKAVSTSRGWFVDPAAAEAFIRSIAKAKPTPKTLFEAKPTTLFLILEELRALRQVIERDIQDRRAFRMDVRNTFRDSDGIPPQTPP